MNHKNPILRTERFILTPLQENDFREMLSMYQEPDSNTYVRPLQNKSKQEYLDFFQRKLEQNSNGLGQGMWVIRNPNGEFVGSANLNELTGTDWMQVGCHLKKSFWKQGVATEVCRRLRDYGFDELHLNHIYGIFEKENLASGKLLKRLGFHFDRTETFMGIEVELYICKKNS